MVDSNKPQSVWLEVESVEADLVRLIEKRIALVSKVKELPTDLDSNLERRIGALVEKTTTTETARKLGKQVLTSISSLEAPRVVSVCALPGSPVWEVAEKRFGEATYKEATRASAFVDIMKSQSEFAVVPMESRRGGGVSWTVAELFASDLKIIAMMESEETLHLASFTGNLRDVERLYATSYDRLRAEEFIGQTLSKTAFVEVTSPRLACELASEDHGAGCLSAQASVASFGLKSIKENVMDGVPDRYRVAVVGARPMSKSDRDRTAIAFTLADAPGALLDALKPFSTREINVSRLQSQPDGGRGWTYLFYAEVDGHPSDRNVVAALEDVKRTTRSMKVLGSFSIG